MDEMNEYEVSSIVDSLPYCDMSTWEQVRLQIYTIAQTQSTKKLSMKELISFPWDKGVVKEIHNTDISNDDIIRLQEKAELIQKKNYGK